MYFGYKSQQNHEKQNDMYEKNRKNEVENLSFTEPVLYYIDKARQEKDFKLA